MSEYWLEKENKIINENHVECFIQHFEGKKEGARPHIHLAVEILHMVLSCRGKAAQVGSAAAHFIYGMQIELHARFGGDGGQMERGVGGASQSHIHRQGVAECLFCHNDAGAQIALQEFHNRHSRLFCEVYPL